ncbi:hypothetical protein BH20ACI3_BH20ACI3_40270 [soil metagenome]
MEGAIDQSSREWNDEKICNFRIVNGMASDEDHEGE